MLKGIDGFFIEYDGDRTGDFTPLEYISNDGPRVVLGVFTPKHNELEAKENIIVRVKEASQYVQLENLCISSQCGFATTHYGNIFTEEEQVGETELYC